MADDVYDRFRERDAIDRIHSLPNSRRDHTKEVNIPSSVGREPTYFMGGILEVEKTFDLHELLLGDINRLRYTWRFNMSHVGHRENVAEHSYYVAMYSYWLYEWTRRYTDKQLDFARIMITALFHDAEESRTGDFSRLFKHAHPELKACIEKYARLEFQKVASAVLPKEEGLVFGLTNFWDHSKDETREGCIIALADFMSVFSHMWQEVNTANATMLDHYDTMLEYVGRFSAPEFEFLRPIIDEVQPLVQRVLGDEELRRRIQVR